MSTLQIGLAIAGGVVLAGVVAHSTWTSRRNKPRQAEPLPQEMAVEPSGYKADYGQPQEPSFDIVSSDQPHDEPEVAHRSVSPTYTTSGSLDPVTDMARSMMEEATAHAQRVPDEAELAQIAQSKAAAAKVAAERAAQQAAQAPVMAPGVAKVMESAASDLPQPEKRPALDALIDVIAAVVLGGARITGGTGTVMGTLLGVFLVVMIISVLIMAGVPSTWQRVVVGSFILVAGAFFVVRSKR